MSSERFIFLVVSVFLTTAKMDHPTPGFLTVKSNLLSGDPAGGEAMMLEMHHTTRPPHRIFFFENGDKLERVIEDDLVQMAPIMDPSDQAARVVVPTLNFTGHVDPGSQTNFGPTPNNFNANKGDSNSVISQDPPPQKDAQDYPSLLLTPQQFLHIKVAIPRAYYTTRLYQGFGDVDIVEVVSKPNGITNTQRSAEPNSMNFGSPQPIGQSLFNSQPMIFSNQPSGWPQSGFGVPNQRTVSGVRQNQPNDSPVSPYGGSSPYSMGNPGQYNLQNSGPNNFNRPADYGGNSQYGGPNRFPVATPRGMDNHGLDYAPQNGPQSFQVGQPYGQPNNQLSQYPNIGSSGGNYDYNRGFQNPSNTMRPNNLFSSGRLTRPGMPPNFVNADSALKNTQPMPQLVQNVLNAVRSLDDGSGS